MDFGGATGFGKISGEYFSLAAGVDTTSLFQGLRHNFHLFYWPPGHNVKVDAGRDLRGDGGP